MHPLFYGSSRITWKDALDLLEKEFAIPASVRHPYEALYKIPHASACTPDAEPADLGRHHDHELPAPAGKVPTGPYNPPVICRKKASLCVKAPS